MMRHIRSWLILLAILLLPTLATAATSFSGRVVGVLDGDTIEVLRGGKAVRVRLYGIDTPEKRQPYGTRARQFTSDKAFKETVTVLVRDTDRYGRIVGEVFLPDGHSLNQGLVEAGLAWWYRQYAKGDTTLERLETQARQKQRGLWADAAPVAPWEWRKAMRSGGAPAATSPAPAPATPPPTGCCKTCRKGKACGDSCIARNRTCTKPPGCACDG